MQTLIVSDLEEELSQEKQQTKYQYKVNTNLSYGFLKNRIIKLLFSKTDMENIVVELKTLFRQHLVTIRPNRKQRHDTAKYRRRENQKSLKIRKVQYKTILT
ncbi:hypothetical protein ABW636_03120 [Aquimarina sp. 2201CG1-2-11]|uniref:hypothetical protein n=1 Tax=Aquimarina discodermiae TaxID=3231043 RepID=UPI003462B567